MTKDEIIRMALDTGFDADDEMTFTSLERFAALVAAAEREAWAKVADVEADEWGGNSDGFYASRNIAAAIRARGNT